MMPTEHAKRRDQSDNSYNLQAHDHLQYGPSDGSLGRRVTGARGKYATPDPIAARLGPSTGYTRRSTG